MQVEISMFVLLVLLPLGVLSKPQDYHVVGQGGYEEYMSDWNSDSAWFTGGRLHPPKCIDIPANMSLCNNIGYTQMRLPNLLDHDTLQEVTSQAGPWVPLLGLQCHADTKLFLCSLFSPVCLDRPIWPCRTLCEAVKIGCESKMMRYGFPWPDMLRCDKFPKDNDLCISKQSEGQTENNVCPACNHPETFEAIVDSYCSSNFALRIRVKDNVLTGKDMKITAMKKKKKYKDQNLTRKDLRNLMLYVEQAASCDCPVLTSTGKKDNLIVVGNKVNNRLIITHMAKFDKQHKETRRAMKAIRKSADICKGGLKAITDTVGSGGKGKKNKKNKRRKRKNGNSDVKQPVSLDENQNMKDSTKDNRRHGKKDRRKNNRNNREGKRNRREN